MTEMPTQPKRLPAGTKKCATAFKAVARATYKIQLKSMLQHKQPIHRHLQVRQGGGSTEGLIAKISC